MTDVAGPHRFKLKIQGVTSHSGSTPMPMRIDALTTSAEIILKIEEIGRAYHDKGIVTTVGYADVYPNTMNAIPGEVTLLIDIRGKNEAVREQVVDEITSYIERITDHRNAHYELEDLGQDARSFNHKIAKINEDNCQQLGYTYNYMYSGAGHDAMIIAPICPTSMIFIPCKEGISHSPKRIRHSRPNRKGINLLIHTTIELAKLDTVLE